MNLKLKDTKVNLKLADLQKTPLRFVPIVLAVIIWGMTSVPAKFALEELPPFVLLTLRSALGLITLLPLALCFRESRHAMLPARGEWLYVLGMGLTGIFMNNGFFFYAAQHTTVTNIAVFIATSPLITALLARIFLGEPLTLRRILGIVIAFIGAILLMSRGDLSVLLSLSFNPGDASELMAAFSISMMAILSRKVHDTPAVTAILWCLIVGTILSAISVIIFKEPIPSFDTLTQLSSRTMLSLLFMGILASGVAYIMQQISIQWVGATSSVAFFNAQPAVAIIGAVFILHESISMTQIISSVIIFCGIFLNAGQSN